MSARVQIFNLLSEARQDLIGRNPNYYPPERLERVAFTLERFRENIKADTVRVDHQQFLSRLVFPENNNTHVALKYYNYIVREAAKLMH